MSRDTSASDSSATPPRFWKKRKVLVAGGAGFIGSHLAERLLAFGAEVTVADANERTAKLWFGDVPEPPRVELGDLREPAFATRVTHGQEVVFHLASKIAGLRYNAAHHGEMLVDNALLDLQVLKQSVRNGVPRTLFCSGALVYDVDRSFPTPEDAGTAGTANPDCEGSAWGKRIGERAARYFANESGSHIVIARLSNVYGPRDDFAAETAHLIGTVIRRLADGKEAELHGSGSERRSYLYVADAVEALIRLLEVGPSGEPVNVGSTVEVSVRDVVEMIHDVMGAPCATVSTPGPVGVARRVLDIRKLQSLTGFHETVALRDGLARTAEWFLRHRAVLGV